MFYGNFFPILFILRFAFFAAFAIFVILTVVFWVIFAIKKYQWAKITAIVVSSVLGLIFLAGIATTILGGFMAFHNMPNLPFGRGNLHHFHNYNNLKNGFGLRRY
jgi:hypothetical protein